MEDQRPSSRHEREDKGKGKARNDELPPPPPENNTPVGSSVLSRIARSAAGLGRDVVNARPSGRDLGSLAAIASTDKATSAAALQEAGPASAGSLAADSRLRAAGLSSSSSGTSAAVQQHVSAQEAEFSQFLDGIPSGLTTEQIVGLDGSSLNINNGSASGFQAPYIPPTQHHAVQLPSSAVAEQENRDGLDVVNLLAAGGLLEEEEPDYAKDVELAEDEADALRHILFDGNANSTGHSSPVATRQPPPVAWDSVLNFIPDFVRPNAGDVYEQQQQQQQQQEHTTGPKSRETQAVMGMGHAPETTRIWLDQWHDVLTRYDDEVWGGLAPLVVEARTEVDQLSSTDLDTAAAIPQTTALNRLRQILGHLREDV